MAKVIKDPLYGSVRLPELLMRFVDTVEFQRLRRLRQLGPVHHVYPSMNHTRFEHSIGVAHLAGVVIDHLVLECGLDVETRVKQLVQLAGLFHDTGHGPFSHLWDDYLEENGVVSVHETRSVEALTSALAEINIPDILSDEELLYVGGIIDGTALTDPPCLGQIVNNYHCGIDVDKFDYICRDAYHGGLQSVDINYIIANIRLDNRGNLAFRNTCESTLEDLFYIRNRLHGIVYQHPTVLKFKAKYLEAIDRLYGGDVPHFLEIDDFSVESALRCTDSTAGIMFEIDTRSFLSSMLQIRRTNNRQSWDIIKPKIPFV